MDAIDSWEHAGLTVRMVYDTDQHGRPPTREWDMAATFYVPKTRDTIDLSTTHASLPDDLWTEAEREAWDDDNSYQRIHDPYGIYSAPGYDQWQDVANRLEKKLGAVAEVVYIDGSARGVAWMDRAAIVENYGHKRATKSDREKARQLIKAECSTLAQWAAGEVYGYIVGDDENDHLDSLWGIYDEWPYDYLKSEANSAAESIAEERRKEAQRAEHATARC